MFQQPSSQPVSVSDGLPRNVALFGNCEAHFAFTNIDAQFAQSLLPPDLELAPQQYAPVGYHPVLLMFNITQLYSNENLERLSDEYQFKLNLNYNEFIVMLPFVQFKDENYNQDAPYCFLPILYLDSLLAVLGGRIFWEFNKEMAQFNISSTEYDVIPRLSKTALFTSMFTVEGAPVIDTSLANFNAISPILNLPVLEYGDYGYVSSVYKIGYENVMITPTSVQLTNLSCKYLPPGPVVIPNIKQAVMGCFSINYEWTLTYIRFIKL